MTDAISRVKTGQITYAVRDTRIDDKEIHEGDIMESVMQVSCSRQGSTSGSRGDGSRDG